MAVQTGEQAAVSPTLKAGRPGAVPALLLTSGAGLLLCSIGDALSRSTSAGAMVPYWIGLLLIALPIFFRLTSSAATPGERLALACLLGLALFGVKVLRDSPMFTFNDELIHGFNAEQIHLHKHLFHGNPLLPVTPYYPGLEGATSALTQLTGLSTYAAGTVLLIAARLAMVAGLFFLFQRVSGSARTAGLGAALYACNFNFFFYEAQYSYESLALPLLVIVLMLLAEREASPREALRSWAAPIGLAIAATVVTHHLTSYTLVGVLVVLTIVYWVQQRSWRPPSPWVYAIFAAVLAGAWLLFVGSSTIDYLSPPLKGALHAIGHTIAGEEPPRGLFQGSDAELPGTPLGARAIAVLAVVLLVACLPLGLLKLWRRYRRQPFAIVFGLAAIGFFATLALRLAPEAWETGNRASEFLFIGLAFVIACAGLQNWRPRSSPLLGRLAITAGFAVLLAGGSITGWPWDTTLAQPLRVAASENGEIVSQPLAMAEWARDEVPGGRFAATTADANLLLMPGGKDVTAGASPDIADILADPNLAGWQLPVLESNDLRYVVADRRKLSSDGIRGYYFSRDDSGAEEPLRPTGVVTKFQRLPKAARIYSNGAISVFDLEGRP